MNDAKIPSRALSWYRKVKSVPVRDDIKDSSEFRVVRGNFVYRKLHRKTPSDKLTRSLIHHDSDSVARAIFSLL